VAGLKDLLVLETTNMPLVDSLAPARSALPNSFRRFPNGSNRSRLPLQNVSTFFMREV